MRVYKRCCFQKKMMSVLLLHFIVMATLAQVTISGKVTDNAGNGIAGVSVIVKNSNFGGSTNAQGNYTFASNLKGGSYVLEFSGIGFKKSEQAFTIGNSATYNLNAQLVEDPLGLDEVVITGTSAGTTRRQLGSYISSVKGDQLLKGATGNVLSALQGKTAGAQIIQNSGDPAGGVFCKIARYQPSIFIRAFIYCGWGYH